MYGKGQGSHLIARCSTTVQVGLIISESQLYIHGVPLIRYYVYVYNYRIHCWSQN